MTAPLLLLPLRDSLAGQDRSGVVTATGAGALRFVEGGALVEEGSTNRVNNPYLRTNTTNSNVYNVGEAGPGSGRDTTGALSVALTSYKHVRTAAGGHQGYFWEGFDVVPGTAYTISAYVKAPVPANTKLDVQWFTSAWGLISASAGVTAAAAGIAANTEGRIVEANLVAPATAQRVHVNVYTTAGSTGDTVYSTGVQLEAKDHATSVIPEMDGSGTVTAGYTWAGTAHASASTRAATTITIPTANHIDANRGSCVIAFTLDGSIPRARKLLSNPVTDRLSLGIDASGQLVALTRDGTLTRTGVVAPDVDHTAYLEWDGTHVALALDGEPPLSGTRTAPTTGLGSTMYLGSLDGGNETLNGTIRNAAFFDDLLTAPEQNHLTRLPDNLFAWDYLLSLPVPIGPTGTGGEIDYIPRFYAASKDNVLGRPITSITGGTADDDIDRAIKSTATFTSDDPADLTAYTWIASFVDIRQETGELDSRQTGLHRLGQPTITGDESRATASVTGQDVTILLANRRVNDTYDFTQGQSCLATLIDLLGIAGITRHALPATDRVWAVTHSHKPNWTVLALLNDALRIMGWHSIGATDDGRPTSRPYRALQQETPTRTYRLGERSDLIGDIVTERSDNAFANHVIVTRDHYELGYLQAEATNDDPNNRLSTTYPEGLGGPGVVSIELADNELEDITALQARANQELASRSIAVAGTLRVMPDLGLTVHDVIAIVVPDDSPHLKQAEGKWLVQQLSHGHTPATAPLTVRIRRSEHG